MSFLVVGGQELCPRTSEVILNSMIERDFRSISFAMAELGWRLPH
jgi:hypothetical protein